MGETSISWTHRPGTTPRTWNPTQGCRRVSAGCERCYAERQARRFAGPGKPFDGLINLKTGKWTGEARLASHKLAEPLSWRSPSTVFVDSMSDLFYERFTNVEIAAVFGVMAATPQHTYQILTKRPDRMRAWFSWIAEQAGHQRDAAIVRYEDTRDMEVRLCLAWLDTHHVERKHVDYPTWPLPNAWIGVSVENQEAAVDRIPELLATPAAVRFLSCEPLLGPVDLLSTPRAGAHHDWLTGERQTAMVKDSTAKIDWVIAGCESGPGARECRVEWLRSLRDQCVAAGVPYFLKQAVDTWTPDCEVIEPTGIYRGDGSRAKGRGFGGPVIESPYLDGKQHMEWPR